jgi:hypothetical protein
VLALPAAWAVHVCIVTSHTLPPHAVSFVAVQATQCPVVVSHACMPLRCVQSASAVHAPHVCPVVSQRAAVADVQSPIALHATHVCIAVLHTAVAPEHVVLSVHCTHWCCDVSHAVAPV